MQLALGLIETKGLIGAIEAADAMAKAADVKIINKEKSTAALVTIKIEGEVAAVKSAIEAGAAAAQRVGQLISTHIIPRPHDDIDFIVNGTTHISAPSKYSEAKRKPKFSTDQHSLFDDGGKLDDFPETDEPVNINGDEEQYSTILDEVDNLTQTGPLSSVPEVEDIIENDSQEDSQVVEPDEQQKIISSENGPEKSEVLGEFEAPQQESLSHIEKLKLEARKELGVKADDETFEETIAEKSGLTIPPMDELEKLNVHDLRKVARSIGAFPIKGREISKANRQTLLDYFSTL